MLFWEQEIHHRKHAFFDFSSISRADHKDGTRLEIDGTDIGLAATMLGWICFETWDTKHMPLRFKHPALPLGQPHKHVVHKQTGPRLFSHHPHRNARCFIMANCGIFHKNAFACQVRLHICKQGLKVRCGQRLVDVSPVHTGRGVFVAHQESVFGRPPCEGSGGDGQGS